MADARGTALGDFLRTRRERLSPKSVGLPARARRRTPGLRREEVAELAGIGIDWYVRLEQGRSIRPSQTTIDALARALRLTKAEHTHLRALANDNDRAPFRREHVPETIRRLVESLNQPAYITGRRWDVLAFNKAADEVFAFGRIPEAERNTLIIVLTNPETRRLFGKGWTDVARRMVAQFRTTHDLWVGDPAFVDLIARLQAGCPEFSGWWNAHEIRDTTAGQKEFMRRKMGSRRYEYASFQANDDPALRLTIYTPV